MKISELNEVFEQKLEWEARTNHVGLSGNVNRILVTLRDMTRKE